MKIKELHLEAFGSFSNYIINFAPGGNFSLIYGENEAGKTTVLRAIKDFLYGIPARSPDAHHHLPKNLRLKAVLEIDGKEITLIRRKGQKNTLLDENNNPVDDSILQLDPIHREVFSLMFGMDHQSLRQGGENLLEGQGVLGEALFEAASGIGGLRKLFRDLDNEAGTLYKIRASTPVINKAIKQYKDAQTKMADLSLKPQKWQELEHKYETQKKQVDKLKENEQALMQEKSRLERLENTLPLVAERKHLLQKIHSMGDIPILPPSFKEERIQLINKRNTAITDQKQAAASRITLAKELSLIMIPEKLLGFAPEIAALYERLGTYRDHIKEIPTREGEKSKLQEETRSLLRQLDPSLSSLQEAEKLRLPHILVREIKDLAENYPLLNREHVSAQQDVEKLELARKEKIRQKNNIGPRINFLPLLHALNRARKKGDLEEELRKYNSNANALENRLKQKLYSLPLWSGTLEELLQLPLPLIETVHSYEIQFREIQNNRKKTEKEMAVEEIRLAENKDKLTSQEFAVPTEHELEEARKYRQRGWNLVRRAWLEGRCDEKEVQAYSGDHQPLESAYETSVTRADEVADLLRYQANRVEHKKLLQAEITKGNETMEKLNAENVKTAHDLTKLNQDWSGLWEHAKITPLSPGEMVPWLHQRREMITEMSRLNEERTAEKMLREKITSHKEEISQELRTLGQAGAIDAETLEKLIDRAQEICDSCQNTEIELKNIEDMCNELEKNIKFAETKKRETENHLTAWEHKWAHAIKKMGLEDNASTKAVLSYLERLENLFHKIDDLARKQIPLDKMYFEINAFTTRLNMLLENAAPDLRQMPPDSAVTHLQNRVTKAQRDQVQRNNLEQQHQKAQTADTNAAKSIATLNEAINALLKQARCHQESDLQKAEEKSEQWLQLRKDLTGLEEQLLAAGRGRSLDKIISEAEAVDGDTLPGKIGEINQGLMQNREDLDQLNQALGAIKKEYQEKIGGNSLAAVEAAEEAQSILAELKSQTEEYSRMRLASMVLRRGIERYREQNQSPMIKKAGDFFARLTHNSFAGLNVDFDDKDNPVLLGLRPSGAKISVAGMSDGTLDQLYLSLRLASLERYLEQNKPLPFILDDLLVNFDDPRAAETLKVLGEFSRKTQVLFFTHHHSLKELAKTAIPRLQEVSLAQGKMQ